MSYPYYKYCIGIAIGRTHPFHTGHKYLIDTMLKKCAKAYWFIGSPDTSRTVNCPYTVSERISFLATLYGKEICEGRLIIKKAKDLGNIEKWGEYILSQVPEGVDAYFAGSESDAYPFEKHNLKIENLHRDIQDNCISGTEIRKMIKEDKQEWCRYVPPELWGLTRAYNTLMGEGYDYK